MLTMTDNAVLVIRDLAAQQDVGEDGGLRIAADTDAGSLSIELVPQPAQGDQVVDNEGARIFLDADAAELLNDDLRRRDRGRRGDRPVRLHREGVTSAAQPARRVSPPRCGRPDRPRSGASWPTPHGPDR